MVSLHRLALAVLVLLGLNAAALAGPSIPPLSGRVMDRAHVLDQRTIDALTRQLADHEASTTNQIVVVTLPSLQEYAIEDWGRALLNGWGIGQRGKNNGVVLVVAPNDRRMRIEVGYGLEYALNDKAAAGIIENEIIPRFKGGDLPGGVTAGVNAILQTIAGTYRPPLIEASGPLGIGSVSNFERYLPMVGFPLLFVFILVMKFAFGGNPARRAGSAFRNDDDDWRRRDRDGWGSRSSSGSSGGGFSGGGGRSGGGGASGRW
jgi:uncharacterized protein